MSLFFRRDKDTHGLAGSGEADSTGGDSRPSAILSQSTGRPLGLWDGGRSLLFFVLAALSSLLLSLLLLEPLGFYGSVVLAEVVGFALVPFLLSRVFDTGWSQWMKAPDVPRTFWILSVASVLSFALVESNLPVLLDRIYPIPSTHFEMYHRYLSARTPWELALLVIVAAVVPGICEEITFRGLIFAGLRRSFGPRHAVVWSALLFALLHLNPWNFLGLWAFGCLLGYLTERSGSIRPAILIHALNNTTALIVFAVQGPKQWERPLELLPWYVTLPAGVILVGAVSRLHRLPIGTVRTDPDITAGRD